MNEYIIAGIAQRRFNDLTSDSSSVETKSNAARWYAEMMIDKFFSARAKENLENEDVFHDMALAAKIQELKKYSPPLNLISSLEYIKTIGDRGSHYHPNHQKITSIEAEKVVKMALSLFDLALVELLKDRGLWKSKSTATIFSTFLPAVRVRVLEQIIKHKDDHTRTPNDTKELLWKWALALIKDNKKTKALRKVDDWTKKQLISQEDAKEWKNGLNAIHQKSRQELLPIAQNAADCKRNFNDCLKTINQAEKNANQELIELFHIMLDQITPSEMGNKIPNFCLTP